MKISPVIKNVTKKIRLFDVTFIAIAIISLIIFFLVFKRETVFITIRAKMIDNDEFTIGYVLGDKEIDEIGRTISEIVNIDSYKVGPFEQAVYLDIKLKVTYNPRTKIYSTKGKDILFGESFSFAFSKARFKGKIVDVPGLSEALQTTNKKTVVKAQVRYENRSFSDISGVPEFFADAVKKGDTVVDTKGNILATILDIKITPAKRVVVTSNGQSIIIDDPVLKDVYFTIELATKEVYGKLYMFDYKPLLIGESIPVFTRHAALWPTITDIIE